MDISRAVQWFVHISSCSVLFLLNRNNKVVGFQQQNKEIFTEIFLNREKFISATGP